MVKTVVLLSNFLFLANCKHDSSLFTCNNGRCIDKKLVCDGYNHCGDNYDETHGCSYGGKIS